MDMKNSSFRIEGLKRLESYKDSFIIQHYILSMRFSFLKHLLQKQQGTLAYIIYVRLFICLAR